MDQLLENIEPIPKPEKQKKPFRISLPSKQSRINMILAGYINLTKKEIEIILGIAPNSEGFDPTKTRYQWDFCINGRPFSIFERYGEHLIECDPKEISILKNCFLGFFKPIRVE